MSFNCFLRINNISCLLLNHLVYYIWFRETGSSAFTLLMKTFYRSHITQVAEETIFRKHTVPYTVISI